MKYNLAVCGGTFDHFHKGHREFLHHALSISNKLLVGLTTDKYVKEKNKGEWIEDYQIRRQQLEQFLRKKKVRNRVSIAPIDDIFIPKVWESFEIEAIIVSEDTVSGAEKINLKRKEQGKYPLRIKVYSLVRSENNGYISSSRIRNGEINREGIPYVKPIWFKIKLLITEKLRRRLKKPFGVLLRRRSLRDDVFKRNVILVSRVRRGASRISKVVRDSGQARMTHNPYLITVGDVTTKTFNDLGLNQDISVVDFKVARKKKFSSLTELGFSGGEKIIKIDNPAGCLTASLFKAVSQIFKLKVGHKSHLHPERAQASRRISLIIQIDGEEDLSVLPLIIAAPLESVVFYGQPKQGIVKIDVSEKTKETAYNLVSQFKS